MISAFRDLVPSAVVSASDLGLFGGDIGLVSSDLGLVLRYTNKSVYAFEIIIVVVYTLCLCLINKYSYIIHSICPRNASFSAYKLFSRNSCAKLIKIQSVQRNIDDNGHNMFVTKASFYGL